MNINKWQAYAQGAHRYEFYAAIAAAAISVIGSNIAANRQARAQIDAVETPTRQSTVEQSLIESFESQETESTTNVLEEIFGSEVTDQLSQAYQNQITNETSSTSELGSQTGATEQQTAQTTERGDAGTQQALAQLQDELAGPTDERMQAAIDQVLRSGLPAVSGAGANAGAFNDTTTALLQNDLTARAASAALDAEDTQRQQLLDSITAGQAGTESTTGTASTQEQIDTLTQALQELQSQTSTESTEEVSSETSTSQTRDATESTEGTNNTSSVQGDTVVSDAYANPGDHVVPTGDLATLVNTGQGDQVLNDVASNVSDIIADRVPSTEIDTPAGSNPGLIVDTPVVNPTVSSGLSLNDGTDLAAVINSPSIQMDDEGNLQQVVDPSTDIITGANRSVI